MALDLVRAGRAHAGLLKDIHPTGSSNPASLVTAGGLVFFTADDGVHGPELWKSDGTAAGTALVADIRPGPIGSWPGGAGPQRLTAVGSRMFFLATDGTAGVELWVSDGSTAGTHMVRDLAPGPEDGWVEQLTAFGDQLLFAHWELATGLEPWITDGTAAGTTMVADFNPGPGWSLRQSLGLLCVIPGTGRALFCGSDGVHGLEPCITDGTAAGTRLFHDLAPGPYGSQPHTATLVGSRLYFAAGPPDTGDELYAIDDVAAAIPYGFACSGGRPSGPRLTGEGSAPGVVAPFLGNGAFALWLHEAPPASPVLLPLGLASADLPIPGGCSWQVDPLTLIDLRLLWTDGTGIGVAPLPIPLDPALAGASLFACGLALPSLSPDSWATTHGLRLVLAPR